MKPSDNLIFYLVDDEIVNNPVFNSQKEIEEWFGEPVPFTIDDYKHCPECFWNYLEIWKEKHKFKIVTEDWDTCDRYTGTEYVTVIYTLEGKYYSISYYSCIYREDELDTRKPSFEVEPVEKTIIEYVPVNKG